MPQINITFHERKNHLHLMRGTPRQADLLNTTAHMVFSFPDFEVKVWIVGHLTDTAKQQVVQSILTNLEILTTPEISSGHTAPGEPHLNRILIVDDEVFTLDVFQTFLELSGYQVITSLNSEQVVQLVAVEHPDCILLDVMMPGLDGFSLCKLIRACPNIGHVPIIFCTAYAALDVEERRAAAGGDLVIMKPMDMKVLVEAIDDMVRRHQTSSGDNETHSRSRKAIKQTMLMEPTTVSLDPEATIDHYVAAVQRLLTGS